LIQLVDCGLVAEDGFCTDNVAIINHVLVAIGSSRKVSKQLNASSLENVPEGHAAIVRYHGTPDHFVFHHPKEGIYDPLGESRSRTMGIVKEVRYYV